MDLTLSLGAFVAAQSHLDCRKLSATRLLLSAKVGGVERLEIGSGWAKKLQQRTTAWRMVEQLSLRAAAN
jgi:hypothetical protein